MTHPDVLVAGGGVVGLSVAWRAAVRGLSVTVVDADAAAGAWQAAAGMLAPVTEAHPTERPLLELNRAAAGYYPEFVGALEDASGLAVGYRRVGTLAVAWDAADLRALRDQYDVQRSWGLDVDMVTGRELRELEPNLAPGLPGGVLAPGDHEVEPARLHAALLTACRRAGVDLLSDRVVAVTVDEARARGVRMEDGREVPAGDVVVACGAWSRLVDLAGVAVPVRPVRGQTVHLAGAPGLLTRVVRGSVRGSPVYLVPRSDGRIVVGASAEDAGFDMRPRAGAVYDLLRDAQALVPGVGELALDSVHVGLRPGSPDNAPLVGPTEVDGLVLATGHYRNGILLAPFTGEAIAGFVAGDVMPASWAPFTPCRFAVEGAGCR